MEIGKVPNNILNSLILGKIKQKRVETIVGPGIGIDCGVIDFGEYVAVLSTDPVTGSTKNAGTVAINVTCNDIAAAGVEPLGVLVTLLAPPNIAESELAEISSQINSAAESLNVDVIGGHTEITDAVTRLVLSVTAIGKARVGNLLSHKNVKPGNNIVITKTCGLEGTAIIVSEKENELVGFMDKNEIGTALGYFEKLSVLNEAMSALKNGAVFMHDVTEGGLLGAVWEICEAVGYGAVIYENKIPVSDITARLCNYFGINPLKLISSGCLLIICGDGSLIVDKLVSAGIEAAVIGEITYDPQRRILTNKGCYLEVGEPGPDELYKVIKK